jgi:predicted DNA-binding WGR domain protein
MNNKVEAWELRYVDPAANSNKFYRIYTVDSPTRPQAWTVLQWGRIGTLGQWKVQLHPSHREALDQATTQHHEKVGKGYVRHGSPVTFDAPDVIASAPKAHTSWLEREFVTAMSAGGTVETEAEERIAARDTADTEAFKSTLLRMAGKLNAGNERSTNGSPTVQTEAAPADDMETRLAAALAAAKAARG